MGDHVQHVAPTDTSPGIIHVGYVVEMPGSNPADHISDAASQRLMQSFVDGQHVGAVQQFDTAESILEYQRSHGGLAPLQPGAMNQPNRGSEPIPIYGISSFDTGVELSPFDTALLEAAFVQQQNDGLRAAHSDSQRYTLGTGTATYLRALGINPNYLHVSGGIREHQNIGDIDPSLSAAGATEGGVHIRYAQAANPFLDIGEYNTEVGPVPLIVLTDPFIQGEEGDDTQEAVGGAGIVLGAGALAAGGALGYGSMAGLNALAAGTPGGATGAMFAAAGTGAGDTVVAGGALTAFNPLIVGGTGAGAGAGYLGTGVTAAGNLGAEGTIGATVLGGAGAGNGAAIPVAATAGGGLNPMFSGGGASGLEGAGVNPATGLRYRGPSARDVGRLISSGGTAATGMGSGAIEATSTLATGVRVGTVVGVLGVTAILAGIVAVASSDDATPSEASGHVVYNAGVDHAPDPLSQVNYGQAEANYMNNMDEAYLSQGATPEQMTTIHEFYAAALQQPTPDQVQANFADLSATYGAEVMNNPDRAAQGASGGHTADSGGGISGDNPGGPIDDPNAGGDEPEPEGDGQTVDDGGGNGGLDGDDDGVPDTVDPDPVDPDPLVDPDLPTNPYQPDLDPIDPFDPYGFDDGPFIPAGDDGPNPTTNYQGTGYSYYQFMQLPMWLKLKLLGKKIDDDDY